MAFGVVRLDKVHAVYNGHLESVKPTDSTLVVENGFVGKAGQHFPGERELRRLEVAQAEDSIVLIVNPEIPYEEGLNGNNLEKFAQEAGKASRAYPLQALDIVSLSDNMIQAITGGTPVAGNYVVVDGTSFKLKEVTQAELTGNEKFVGRIFAKEQLGSQRWITGQAGVLTSFVPLTVIEVLSN